MLAYKAPVYVKRPQRRRRTDTVSDDNAWKLRQTSKFL